MNNVSNGATATEEMRHLDNRHVVYDDDDDDDNQNFWKRSHQNYNQTIITSTVTIRVTPRDDYMVSWGILVAALMVAIGYASWQVYRERHVDQRSRSGGGGGGSGGGGAGAPDSDRLVESASTAEVTRCVVSHFCFV